jgi:hypothetical protein
MSEQSKLWQDTHSTRSVFISKEIRDGEQGGHTEQWLPHTCCAQHAAAGWCCTLSASMMLEQALKASNVDGIDTRLTLTVATFQLQPS